MTKKLTVEDLKKVRGGMGALEIESSGGTAESGGTKTQLPGFKDKG